MTAVPTPKGDRGRAAAGLAAAVARVRAGGLVAFPTETVWGLGADARSDAALERLRRWKGRAAEHPMAVLVAGPDALGPFGFALDGAARRLAAAFWPGPLTLVVPAPAGAFAAGVARADGAVGLRCSPHPAAAALAAALARAGVGPLTATSLNRHGERPAGTRTEAAALCRGADAPLYLDVALDLDLDLDLDAEADGRPEAEAGGGNAAGAASPLPSTVIDCTGARPIVLRAGALAVAALERVLGRVLEQEIARS